MSETPDSEGIGLAYQTVTEHTARPPLLRFLSHLVFEAHGLRIGLELSICVISYTLVSLLVPWEALGVPIKWSTLISWFGCCFLIILLDQLVLCRSVYTFRKSYLLSLSGAYERAIQMLDLIGPASRGLIRLPQTLYHLQRAKVFTQAENFKQAETELQLAELAGLEANQLCITRSRLKRAKGGIEEAREELDRAEEAFGKTPALELERGLLLLDIREQLWEAKRQFKNVMEMPDSAHFAGETTYQLARAYWNVTRLWTGEAEEGIDDLSISIDRFRSAVIYVDTLRPILSQLLLERAHYYATHKEPAAAVVDLKLALSFCAHKKLVAQAEDTKEELKWRHDVEL